MIRSTTPWCSRHRWLIVVVALLAACAGPTGEAAPDVTPTTTIEPTPTRTPPRMQTPTATPEEPPDATATVEVYFSNDRRGDPCTEVFPVLRDVAAEAPLRGALLALLTGPTPAERADGYGGWFSDDTADLLDDVALHDGSALVSFDSSLPEVIPNASTSCGSSALLAQLDRTVLQFTTVDEVRYALEGDTNAFYTWLQQAPPDDAPQGTEQASGGDALPSRALPAGLRGTEWERLPVLSRAVALTFDAGANADGVPAILRMLDTTDTPATFFLLTGARARRSAGDARTIGDRHPVGNHTGDHPDVTTLTDAEVLHVAVPPPRDERVVDCMAW